MKKMNEKNRVIITVIQTIFSGSSVKIDSSIQLESYEEKVKNV
jgi:hypothetical protein